LALFEACANHGYVTANHTRDWGSTNGLFPVVRLSQLHHISANGGYARLLTLSMADAREFIKEGDTAHDRWVGAKPLSTQYATERAFFNTRYNKELGQAYEHHYPSGNAYSAQLRVALQRVGAEQEKLLAKIGRTLRDSVNNEPPATHPLARYTKPGEPLLDEVSPSGYHDARGGKSDKTGLLMQASAPSASARVLQQSLAESARQEHEKSSRAPVLQLWERERHLEYTVCRKESICAD
jgi:hypothetical protein